MWTPERVRDLLLRGSEFHRAHGHEYIFVDIDVTHDVDGIPSSHKVGTPDRFQYPVNPEPWGYTPEQLGLRWNDAEQCWEAEEWGCPTCQLITK